MPPFARFNRKSGFRIFACGIHNPVCFGNSEYSSRNPDSLRKPSFTDKESGFRNLVPGIWNPQGWIHNPKLSLIPLYGATRLFLVTSQVTVESRFDWGRERLGTRLSSLDVLNAEYSWMGGELIFFSLRWIIITLYMPFRPTS